MTISVSFAWYDLWVGAYWDQKTKTLYVCPLPTLLITFKPQPKTESEWNIPLNQSKPSPRG